MSDFFELFSQFARFPSFTLSLYLVLSFVYIMIYHFAVNLGSEFNLMITASFFVFGAIIGHFISYELGFITAVVLSFVFISGPRKDL